LLRKRQRLYHALNHPLRREIVELLYGRGSLSSSELKELLNIGPGKLYYHLENLGGLIEQDENQKYRLSKEGKEAYQLLTTSEVLSVNEEIITQGPLASFFNAVKSALLFDPLLSGLYEKPARHIPESVFLLLLGGWLCYVSGLQPFLLYFTEQSQIWYFAMAQFLAGWVVIYALAELICLGLFHRKHGHVRLFVGSALSFAPLILFAGLRFLDTELSWGWEVIWNGWLVRGLLLVCQGWSLTLLTYSVSKAKRLTIDRASLVSLTVAYLNIAMLFLIHGI
jgi:DNA-binding transcriptional ArsR family regulator